MLVNTEERLKLYTSLYRNEQESLICVMKMLSFLQELLENKNVKTICSDTTGEIIEIHEIARARGILDGLLCSEEWESMP